MNQTISERNCQTRFCLEYGVSKEIPARCLGCVMIAHLKPKRDVKHADK